MEKKKFLLKKWYLAGPIGDVSDLSYKTWRDEMTKFLESQDHIAVNPLTKYKGKTGDYKKEFEKLRKEGKYDEVKKWMEEWILPHDRQLVKDSYGIIAYVPEYTIGTTREIALAYEWKKPIYVVTTVKLPANSLIGMATKIFRNWKELKTYFRENNL